MIKPAAHVLIAAPPADVIGFIANPANAERWMKALEKSELITRGPIGPGSRFREVLSAGGERIETICEVVEFDPERRYAWRSIGQGDAQYGGGFTAIAVSDGTELRYEGWAIATGKLAQREAAWAKQAEREARAELTAIKFAVEERSRNG